MRLLIFKVNQLGDNVVFLPVVQQIARQHPDWQITVCTSPAAAPLYYVACPGVEVREYVTQEFNRAWKNPLHMLRLARQFIAAPQDACLLANDQGHVAYVLTWLTGAGRTIGPSITGRYLGSLLRQHVPLDLTQPAPLQNWHIARALVPELPEEMPAPDLNAFGREDHGGVFIHAGASRDYKKWSLENFIRLANRLSTRVRVMWMDQGSTLEDQLAPDVQRFSHSTLAELIRRIAGARLFIGNNSGPMNLASALGTPGIIFNGPSTSVWDPFWHRERFEILRDPSLACQPCDHLSHPVNVCLNAAEPMACMKRWNVDRVHEMAMNKLERAG